MPDLAALLDRKGTRAHFIGVGGAGMAALASMVADRGWDVTGCDLDESASTRELRAGGIAVDIGHNAAHVADAEVVVASAAVPATSPELVAAGARAVKRAELTGALSRRTRAICIAGTAGKTTTTAMCAHALLKTGHDPSALVGAPVPGIGLGGRAGRSDLLVVEADEFDRSFLHLQPTVAVVTNVEADHLDYFGSREAIDEAFREFLRPAQLVLVCGDDSGALNVAPPSASRYGSADESDWQVGDMRPEGPGSVFELRAPDGRRQAVALPLPGRHNALNATAAIAAGAAAGVEWTGLADALATFEGAARRFEQKAVVRGVAVYDDYAHHPTKVRATLSAARQRAEGKVWCVFQPHTFHRTMSLFDDFATAFGDADCVVMLDIYSPAGREEPIAGVDSRRLVAAMRHGGATYAASSEDAIAAVAKGVCAGDLVITMGAGDVTKLAPRIVEALAAR